MKRLISVLCLIAVMISTLSLAGCKKNTEEKNSISIAIMAPDVVASEGTAENNRWTKYIKEQTGLDITWVAIPQSDMKTKLNTLLAAGEAPDMFVEYSNAYFQGLVFDGMLMELDDLIENHSTEYKKYIEENSDLKTWTMLDGKTYAFTNRRPADKILCFGMWIRQDWLDKLNLKAPTNIDEFVEVAKAFKTLGDDIVPLAYPYQFINTIYNAHAQWYEKEDGSGLEYGVVTDRYADSIEMLKRFYEEGIVDKEYFVDKAGSNQYELWNSGKAGIIFSSWGSEVNQTLLANEPNANPVPLEAFSTKYGTNGMFVEAPPQLYVMMNKDCKNPEAGMKFIDWLIGGGWKALNFGEEGVHYKMEGDVPVSICDPDTKKREVDYASKYMLLNNFVLDPEWIPQMANKDELSQRLAKLKVDAMNTINKHHYRRDVPYNPPESRVSSIVSDFGASINAITVKYITGGSQYDKNWCATELKREWELAGGKEAEELATKWYKENIDMIKKFQADNQ
ncbi:MAG: extracellular solute-binding protein [Clostridia bacterium]|nr:extracellular solute-binding protein [Oscillospiraceae bacterium]MDY5626729.1 extracellular solute-binding protein [Clostridia bacterium]